MSKVKLYIGCGLNGAPKEFIQKIHELKGLLRNEYEVLDFIGLSYTSVAQVYKHDIETCVAGCDLFVAICDEPSTGLGYELGEAVHLKKPVLALAHETKKVSGLVLGVAELMNNVTLHRYKDLHKDVPVIIASSLKQLAVSIN